MKKCLALAIILTLSVTGCTQKDKATQVLEAAGYTNIKITGWRPFMKSDNDTFSTGFEADAPNGKHVKGAVTGGFLKGSTIRFD